ncbi:MerR family transcriptional regulator [Cohnella lupini]|nr:MerR family transcriptional regulator [Cohnella lupini]
MKDIADKTGFSQDTIRYYEKIGLLPSPRRSINGQREYTQGDLQRFVFVSQLKRTDMPLREIERYIDFYTTNNYEGCYRVLNEHKSHIQTKMADMAATLDIMNYKLDNFQQIIHSTDKGDHTND